MRLFNCRDGVFVRVCGKWVRGGGCGHKRQPEHCGAKDDGGQDHPPRFAQAPGLHG